jgi:integrase/recombinase XerC
MLHPMQEDIVGVAGLVARRVDAVDDEIDALFGGVRPLRMDVAVFEASLEGWRCQQGARHLAESTKRDRSLLVRRFREESGLWPWEWQAIHVDEWLEDLGGPPRRRAVATLRGYQGALRAFLEYVTDERYPWLAICEREFGRRPVQVIDERNSIVHLSEYEGVPGRRPMTREELTLFFDHCDARVQARRALRRKGSLAAFRDATLFKVIYAWGLRRQEAARLDVSDFGRNPHRSSFGRYGTLSVRYGKASRGGAAKRRNVLTVFDWAVDVVEQYVDEALPLYGRPEHPALWLTERGGRVTSAYVTERFAEYRDELGLPRELSPHALRHSYVTHLIEDGFDELFVQMQVGHRYASTTALYTGVSSDFKNQALQRALRAQLGDALTGKEG